MRKVIRYLTIDNCCGCQSMGWCVESMCVKACVRIGTQLNPATAKGGSSTRSGVRGKQLFLFTRQKDTIPGVQGKQLKSC